MSRTFTLIGRESVLSANYYPPVDLSEGREYGLGLVGFYTFNSILNVDEENNQFAYITAKHKHNIIVIPPGNYEIDSLGKYVQKQIVLAGDAIDGSEDDKQLWKSTFTLKANNSTLKCELRCAHTIDFTGAVSLARMLGFSPARYEPDRVHESDLSVEILKHRIIRIECNIVTGAYSNGEQVHTIFEFDIDVEPGYKLTKEPQNVIYMPIISRGFIDNITLRVLDEQESLIDFKGEQIIVRLELKEI